MLESISIQNFALIDHLKLKVHGGLTVITGETGAGKSTFLQALNVLRGGRAHSNLIRTGTEQAKVEATFTIDQDERIILFLRSRGIREGKKITITRLIWRSKRKNSATINGVQISVNDLQQLMSYILEISGQHDAHYLRQPSSHLSIIDQAAGLDSIRDQLEFTYAQLLKIDHDIKRIQVAQRGQTEREDFLKYQLKELQQASLEDPHEDQKLKGEAVRLRHAERLRHSAHIVDDVLYSRPGAVVEQINEAIHALERLVEVDESLDPLLDDLQTALVITEEVARSASDYSRTLSDDNSGLDEIEERLSFLGALKSKHKGTLAEVIERQREIELELQSFESLDARLIALEEQRGIIGQSLLTQAQALSEARLRSCPILCKSIARELKDLGMPKAKLEVEFSDVLSNQGCLIGDVIVGPRGLERATLLISANPGEPIRPIQSSASGGELSRITLSIKRVIADLDPVSVYIFDEVDSGVGGPTAEALGLKLKHVSRSRQVLCITHLPQVAGIGDQHIFVSKQVKGDRTRSVIRTLSRSQRIEEISRMLGGKRITDKTRANAEELLSVSLG